VAHARVDRGDARSQGRGGGDLLGDSRSLGRERSLFGQLARVPGDDGRRIVVPEVLEDRDEALLDAGRGSARCRLSAAVERQEEDGDDRREKEQDREGPDVESRLQVSHWTMSPDGAIRKLPRAAAIAPRPSILL